MTDTTRKLTTQEMEIMLFLLKTGGGGHAPVKLLSNGRKRATELARMGLVDVWVRQSVTRGRTDGPFNSLTARGRELAQSLYARRATQPRRDEPTTAHLED